MTVPEPASGAQLERTALAWHRTGLSVVVAAAVLARLTYEDLGPPALVALAGCLGLCGWMLLGTRRQRRLAPAERRTVGGWGAAVAGGIALLGLTELAALVLG